MKPPDTEAEAEWRDATVQQPEIHVCHDLALNVKNLYNYCEP
jgi:hypothetical protein